MSDEPKLASDLRALMVAGKHSTRHQPTASADAEQVWQKALSAAAMSPRSRGASFDPDQAAADVIQAYGDARADAARREALEEAAGVVAGLEVPETGLGTVKAQAWCLAIDMGITAIRALKENHNAG